jgi:hypothetical protein
MKRFMTMISALSVLTVASSALAQGDGLYWVGWTLSASNADAFENTGTPGQPGTLKTVYLWYQCNITPPAGPGTGMTAMEADLSGAAPLAALTPMNGFLNAGANPQQLLLVVGGCPDGDVVAGSLLYLNSGVGLNICLVPSAANNWSITVDCDQGGWDNGVIGYSEVGDPCATPSFCVETSVEDETWSGIKSLYR